MPSLVDLRPRRAWRFGRAKANAGTIGSVRLSQRFVRVLLAVTAAAIVVAAHVPAATSIESSDRTSRSTAAAAAGRFEAPLAQLKSLDERQLRGDNDARGIEFGVIIATAALVAGGLVSIVHRLTTQRFALAKRGAVRVRAPPSSLRALP